MVTKLDREIIEFYKGLSEKLKKKSLIRRLQIYFHKEQSLPELLEWIHQRIRFNKGHILRHEDPIDVIEYGQGKCREFSVLFTALCLANGYRARLILDMSDHVWTEVWDNNLGKWIHVDPSEKRINDPEMYERDWKKNLTEVYAIENGKIEEVTRNYKLSKKD
jgi:hypothetical protein